MQNNRDEGVDLRLLVHQSQAGCIIGRGGYKIKELREVRFCHASLKFQQSGLQTLKVYQMLCPNSTDRVIQLVGDVDKVIDCLQSIAELLEVICSVTLSSLRVLHLKDLVRIMTPEMWTSPLPLNMVAGVLEIKILV